MNLNAIAQAKPLVQAAQDLDIKYQDRAVLISLAFLASGGFPFAVTGKTLAARANIPIRSAERSLRQLMKNGFLNGHARLGVTMITSMKIGNVVAP